MGYEHRLPKPENAPTSSPLGKATSHYLCPSFFLQNQADGGVFLSPGCASSTSVTHIQDLYLQNWKSSLDRLTGSKQIPSRHTSRDPALLGPRPHRVGSITCTQYLSFLSPTKFSIIDSHLLKNENIKQKVTASSWPTKHPHHHYLP